MFTIAPMAATLIRLSLLGSMLAKGMIALQAEQEAAGGENADNRRVSIAQVFQVTANTRRRTLALLLQVELGVNAHDSAIGKPVDAMLLPNEGAAAIEREARRRERREMEAEDEKWDPPEEKMKEEVSEEELAGGARIPGEGREAVPPVNDPLLQVAENQPMSRRDKACLIFAGMLVSIMLVTTVMAFSAARHHCINEVWGGEEKAAWCRNKNYFPKGFFGGTGCSCRSVAVPDCYNGVGKELPEW